MKLKKFNEMFDPMGSWNPKQLDNQSEPKQLDNQSEPKQETPTEESELSSEVKKEDFKDQEYLKSLPNNPEKLRNALDKGLDPSTIQQLLLRVCFRDNLIESCGILVDCMKDDDITYGTTTGKEAKSNLCKRAAEYGRIEFLNKFYELGWFNDFDNEDWEDILTWLKISRQMKNRPDDKEKTEKFLLDIKKQ
jgi:hypothetical protein